MPRCIACAALPSATRVYCAHEYTLSNLRFAAAVEPDNDALQAYAEQARQLRAEDRPTLPSTVGRERQVNPFLRCTEPSVVAAAERHAGSAMDDETAVFATIRCLEGQLRMNRFPTPRLSRLWAMAIPLIVIACAAPPPAPEPVPQKRRCTGTAAPAAARAGLVHHRRPARGWPAAECAGSADTPAGPAQSSGHRTSIPACPATRRSIVSATGSPVTRLIWIGYSNAAPLICRISRANWSAAACRPIWPCCRSSKVPTTRSPTRTAVRPVCGR